MNIGKCGQKKLIQLSVVIAVSLLSLLIVKNASGAPAAPIKVTLTQPNGTEFDAIAWGDEWQNGYETLEGYTIHKEEASLNWVYSTGSNTPGLESDLRSQPRIVGIDDPEGLSRHYRPQNASILSRSESLNKPNRSLPSSTPMNLGTQPILVLLVDFKNYPGRTTVAEWSEKIFGPTNSVGHYYFDASFGNLSLVPAEESFGSPNDGIVGWLTLNRNHPDTGGQLRELNLEITREAILAADERVNFKVFDNNDDGYLSYDELHIMVIVAGHESAYGGEDTCSPSVWGHQYYLDYYFVDSPVVDGVKVASYNGQGGYTQFGEIHCEPENAPGHPATIGIIAHELGHDLQWPDLYDTFNQASMDEVDTQGIGNWGLMGTGLWNRTDPLSPYYGDSPSYPTAWSRVYQGWVSPIQITKSSLDLVLPPVATSGVILQLRDNPNGVDWVWNERSGVGEYFLIENRPLVGYDAGLPGAGMLIWHIDESVIFNNFANSDQTHRLVDLIQADGLQQLNLTSDNRGDDGDPYPGAASNTIFNATSLPSSHLYAGISSGVSINNIANETENYRSHFFVPSFDDVLPDEWCWASVEALTASNVTTGTDENHFEPYKATTRGEMAVFLGRAIYGTIDPPLTEPVMSGSREDDGDLMPTFADVDSDYWAAPWIEQLFQDGLTNGCNPEGTLFCPEALISRDQMAAFLVRALFEPPLPEFQGIFKDVSEDFWASAEIEQLYLAGITTGCANSPDLVYCPETTVSRAEMAAFIERAFNLPKP